MPRSCTICCKAAEYRLTVDAKLRAGESQTAIAKEFGFSPDVVARHFKNHVRRADAKPPETHQDRSRVRLEKALAHAEALADQCAQTGDSRGLADALMRLDSLSASLVKLDVQVSSSFESLDVRGKARFVKTDAALYRLLLDDTLHQYPDLVVRGTNADSESRGEHADSVHQLACF